MSSTVVRRRKQTRRGGQAAVHAHAVKAVVQILFATGQAYTVDTLREKLREFFREEGDYEKRAVASLSTIELVTALLEASPTLAAVGLQIRLVNGTAKLSTIKVENERLSGFLAERSERPGIFSQAALEVLACIAFKQPICQPEIDCLFGNTDKRHLVFVLREAKMVEEFPDEKGRFQFATTGEFLKHFKLSSIEELKAAFQEAESVKIQSGFGFLSPQL